MRCCLGPEFKEKRMYHRVRVTDTIYSSQVDEWNANQGMSSSWFPLPMTSLSKYDGGLLNVTCGPQSGPTNLPDRPAVISAETDLSEADPDLTIQLNIYCLGRYLLSRIFYIDPDQTTPRLASYTAIYRIWFIVAPQVRRCHMQRWLHFFRPNSYKIT